MAPPLLVVNRRRIVLDLVGWAGGRGDEVVLLTAAGAATERELAQAARALRRVVVVEDYEHPSFEGLIARLAREHRVGSIISTTETDVLRCARVRQDLGVRGQRTESALAYRDKFVMKSHALAAGVDVAPMTTLEDPGAVDAFLAGTGPPLMAKPRDGAASIDMTLLRDRASARAFADRPDAARYLFEGFVDGPMCHVDGLMADGRLLHAWPSAYLYPQWQTMYESRPNISGMLSRADPRFDPLVRATGKVVGGLPAAPGVLPVHAEFFVSAEDPRPVLCEIACRAGGAGIQEAYARSFGMGMYEATVRAALDSATPEPPAEPATRHGWAWFTPRPGTVVRAPTSCPVPGTVRFVSHVAPGDRLAGPASVTSNAAEASFEVWDGPVEDVLRRYEAWWAAECVYGA